MADNAKKVRDIIEKEHGGRGALLMGSGHGSFRRVVLPSDGAKGRTEPVPGGVPWPTAFEK